MHFHFLVNHWIDTRLAGAEVYHSELAKWLQSQGHVATHSDKVPPECHTVITTSFPFYHEATRAQAAGKRVVFIQHNENREPYDFSKFGVIYCAKHVQAKCHYKAADSVVFYPFNRYAGVSQRGVQGGHVLLTNCNDNKGGQKMSELARMLPQIGFVGINASYGNQRRFAPLLNVIYEDTRMNMKLLYMGSMALLILSAKEGLPTVALEAMSFGMPVVALDIPGTREACGEYVFPNLSAVRAELERLAGDAVYYYARSVTSVARAKEIEEQRDWAGLRRVLGIASEGAVL